MILLLVCLRDFTLKCVFVTVKMNANTEIEDCYCKACTIDNIDCTLDITDTAGQEEYRCVA
jgi:endonuclease V-like protein UPF0215 family